MNEHSQQSHGSDSRTHFGFRDVKENEKAGLVGDVFRSVASRYDVMNDLMSFGAHRLWKRFAVSQSGLRDGDSVLDVAGGSGDLARLFAKQVGKKGRIVLTDINGAMLAEGKSNMIDGGIVGNIDYVLTDAEKLCFPDASFHGVSISFGLRNVTRKEEALKSMCRVLKPGGRLMVLEFSRPVFSALDKAYDLYSFNVIPKIGKLVTNDEESYQYLVESIRKHPDQETLKQMMLNSGFDDVKVHNMSGGIVALHLGYKY
ncbi:MAG: bifunctional demethylmenaquinone methyltransferase/2-methoxy-6-polyprenyl-1,4-benzoquinol methylase UbiE [Gammaproteobacteria bacterium]|nr:bifunctional demethylmenaquinone methyltransferase/2-methoxy-6-polyprenyl-1,4-benzoquinol methylase UbiE [Gammaproteobacteria bacterium]NKB63979.1 bifunctional demethylmenaquinone methyltransferase/2-methoxy-6-polyprenyl-1,4-benzoquinol methylase UbiE [Gammaproteobacteria bacterium]